MVKRDAGGATPAIIVIFVESSRVFQLCFFHAKKTEERQLRACGMEKEAAAIRKQWRRLTVDYQIYSMEHDRAFYPYRYIIDREELPQETLDSTAESAIIKSSWDNDLPPRGQVDLPVDISKSQFIQNELKIDKDTAEGFKEALEYFTGEAYSEIRAYQQGNKDDADEQYKDFLRGFSERLEEFIKRAPRWNGGETFRGVGLSSEELEKFTVGSEHDMFGTSSWSSEKEVAEGFADRSAGLFGLRQVIFHCQTQNKGTAIQHLSNFPGVTGEYEVLVSKDSKYRVAKAEIGKEGITHIYLEEL